MKWLLLSLLLPLSSLSVAQEDALKGAGEQTPAAPFAWGDFTWLQGNSRLHNQVLDSKYFTGDIGFENGGGVVPFGGDSVKPAQNFLSWMLYHRLWLGADERFACTIGGGQLHNPGRYLALLPTGSGTLTQNPGDEFDSWDFSTGLQYMPSEHVTWGLEFVHREASVPYFAGRGGVTSPNGWNPPIGDPTGFTADLVTSENRIIGSFIVRC